MNQKSSIIQILKSVPRALTSDRKTGIVPDRPTFAYQFLSELRPGSHPIQIGFDMGVAFYFAKANIKSQDFNRSVQLISQDEDAGWCNVAQAPIIADRNGLSYCAIAMPGYVVPEGAGD
jgi:hypothetical protein